MFDEFLFTLGDYGKICLPQPYTTASFIFLVQWQIFQSFAYRGRIRKSSSLDRTIGKTTRIRYSATLSPPNPERAQIAKNVTHANNQTNMLL